MGLLEASQAVIDCGQNELVLEDICRDSTAPDAWNLYATRQIFSSHDEYEPCDGTEKGSRPCEIKTFEQLIQKRRIQIYRRYPLQEEF
ncbi:hypothetical protein TNCV_920201 [Trichonephila clavipes]|nr:hypothetical protein TNCV_920201 [Trichonephila clavipes]